MLCLMQMWYAGFNFAEMVVFVDHIFICRHYTWVRALLLKLCIVYPLNRKIYLIRFKYSDWVR